MRIIGIADHINSGTALIVNGDLTSAINDERLVRRKQVIGFPKESLTAILENEGLGPQDIDAIAIATRNQHLIAKYQGYGSDTAPIDQGKYKQILVRIGSRVSRTKRYLPFIEPIYFLIRQPAFIWRRFKLKQMLRSEFGFDCPIYFLDHHFCHASSAYYLSGFSDATVVTMDAAGDGKSSRAYAVENGNFREMASISSFNSLAKLYGYITAACGFKPNRHEGKINGLAAYGRPIYQAQLAGIIGRQNGSIKNFAYVYEESALEEIRRILPADFQHRDLASSVQRHTEDIVTQLVRGWIRESGHSHLALAGGLFANVRVNQKVHELPEVSSLFIDPAMSDEGLPAGAALALHAQLNGRSTSPSVRVDPIADVFKGPQFDEMAIQEALETAEIQTFRPDDIELKVAHLLAQGAVVARFNGAMEYGPRALGNRSILYQASDPTVTYWLNEALARTEFMPFAPIVMAGFANLCFENIDGAEVPTRFMSITLDCTDWMKEIAPGVVHVDGTARPQIVSNSDNPSIHKILSEYHRLTAVPCLINTSFNMHEEPIVCTPADAVRAFKASRLDYLAIGDWIAKHPDPIERRVHRERLEFLLERRGFVHR